MSGGDTWTQWITIVLLVLNGIAMPWMIKLSTDARNERDEHFRHLDECLEEVKRMVLGKAITREDLATHRAEVNEIINRQRTAISLETNALHDRIMRLENRLFSGPLQRND